MTFLRTYKVCHKGAKTQSYIIQKPPILNCPQKVRHYLGAFLCLSALVAKKFAVRYQALLSSLSKAMKCDSCPFRLKTGTPLILHL